jgi:PadR family transcriptional regulator PadR
MSENTQLIRGILEGCILAIVRKKESYGYWIVERLKEYGFSDIHESTVYPILNRLEKKGLFNAKRKPSELGPPRKYYSISDIGLKELERFESTWKNIKNNVDTILEEESN